MASLGEFTCFITFVICLDMRLLLAFDLGQVDSLLSAMEWRCNKAGIVLLGTRYSNDFTSDLE